MKDNAEVIALLMPDADGNESAAQLRARQAQMLVREADGTMSLETISPDSTLARRILNTGFFRKSRPIIDPESRQVVGYEMEMIAGPG